MKSSNHQGKQECIHQAEDVIVNLSGYIRRKGRWQRAKHLPDSCKAAKAGSLHWSQAKDFYPAVNLQEADSFLHPGHTEESTTTFQEAFLEKLSRSEKKLSK